MVINALIQLIIIYYVATIFRVLGQEYNDNNDKHGDCPHGAMVEWVGALMKQVFTQMTVYVYGHKCCEGKTYKLLDS